MSIRAKLAWTFILLLVFGITGISGYSILFIRNYLLQEGEHRIEGDAWWLALTINNLPDDDRFLTHLNETAVTSGYRIAVYDAEGMLYAEVPYGEPGDAARRLEEDLKSELESGSGVRVVNEEESEWLRAYVPLSSGETGGYMEVSREKDELFAPIRTIRWIIYTGMFVSIGLVLVVSVLFARYISRPILQLEETARAIAGGDVGRTLHLNRKDEFGTLAESLNRMASRLRRDHEELRQIYEKQRQFYADITHELRNPLHTVAAAIEMLQMENLSEEQRRYYLATAGKQTERIHYLFKDLMILQRYDSDPRFLEKREFNLAGVMLQVFELFYPAAREKGLEMEVRTDSWRVYGDPNKIEQVLENLVSNALKYTSKGRIDLRAMKLNGEVKVEVEDTGIGIPEGHLPRLFERFYRTDKARSRDQGGTGLGLAVVRSILDAHGSRFGVESRVGRGTLFHFTLPLASDAE